MISRTRIVQRKAYRDYHKDGLLDLTIGLGILGFVVMVLVREIACLVLTWAALFLYLPVKTRIILPRLASGNPGTIPIEAINRARQVAIVILVAAIIVESLVLFAGEFYFPARAWLDMQIWLLLGSMLALTLAAIGVAVGMRRLALYGGLAMILTLAEHYFDFPVLLPFLVVGAVSGLVGAVLLFRFLKRRPLPVS